MNLKINKNDYIKLIFKFLNKTEGFGTEYQYAYMISVLFYDGDIKYTNVLCDVIDMETLDDYVMNNDFDSFMSFIAKKYSDLKIED